MLALELLLNYTLCLKTYELLTLSLPRAVISSPLCNQLIGFSLLSLTIEPTYKLETDFEL